MDGSKGFVKVVLSVVIVLIVLALYFRIDIFTNYYVLYVGNKILGFIDSIIH